MVDQADPELRTYLRRLRWALSSLLKADRTEIVDETQMHVLLRAEQGQSLSQTLAALGSAETYARRFINEMEIADALASQRQSRLFSVVFTRMDRSVTAALAFLAVLFLALLAIGGASAAVMKPFDPDHIGLWVSMHGDFFFGQSNGLGGKHEVLGLWLYPFAVLDVAVVWLASRRILLGAVRSIAQKG